MKHNKKIIYILLLAIIMVAPIKVRAAYSDSCINKYGKVEVVKTDNTTTFGGYGEIKNYSDDKNDDDQGQTEWKKSDVVFYSEIKAKIHYGNRFKVNDITYTIVPGDGTPSCTGIIPKSVTGDKSYVKLKFTINKGIVKEVKVSATQDHEKYPSIAIGKEGKREVKYRVWRNNGQTADNVKIDGCLKDFGSITLTAVGNRIHKITDTNLKTTYKKIAERKYEVVLRGFKGSSVDPRPSDIIQYATYEICTSDTECFKGRITGSFLAQNEGHATFVVDFSKSKHYIQQFKISGVTNNKEGSNKLMIWSDFKSVASGGDGIPKKVTLSCDSAPPSLSSGGAITTSTGSVNIEEGEQLGDMTPDEMACDDKIKELIHKYWGWLMFLTPLFLLIMMTVDFVKAMSMNDADSVKKASNAAFKRVIAAVVLFATPWIVSVVFTWLGLEKYICF